MPDPRTEQNSANAAICASTPCEPARVAGAHSKTGFGVWLRDLVISLAISAFIIIFLYQPVKVEGVSMMPLLEDQETNLC